jgi:hypothetical protein
MVFSDMHCRAHGVHTIHPCPSALAIEGERFGAGVTSSITGQCVGREVSESR